jgi:hypothetical protein
VDFPSALGLFAHESCPDFLATEQSLGAARAAGDKCPGSCNPLSLVVVSRSPGMLVGAYLCDYGGVEIQKTPPAATPWIRTELRPVATH